MLFYDVFITYHMVTSLLRKSVICFQNRNFLVTCSSPHSQELDTLHPHEALRDSTYMFTHYNITIVYNGEQIIEALFERYESTGLNFETRQILPVTFSNL